MLQIWETESRSTAFFDLLLTASHSRKPVHSHFLIERGLFSFPGLAVPKETFPDGAGFSYRRDALKLLSPTNSIKKLRELKALAQQQRPHRLLVTPGGGQWIRPIMTPLSLDLYESAPKRHLDWVSRFCTAHRLTRVPNSQIQTTLRETSVAIGRISINQSIKRLRL